MAYTFTVDYSFSGFVSVEVEADTPEEAEEKGYDIARAAVEKGQWDMEGLEPGDVYVPYEYEVAEMNRVS